MDETFVPLLALAALVKKFVDFSKYVTNRDVNGALTQLFVWIAGIAAVAIFAQTAWADGIVFASVALSKMNFASQVAMGLGISSTGAFATDYLKAKDNFDSARMPNLLPGSPDGTTRTVVVPNPPGE